MSVLEEYNSASDYSEQHTEIAELANRLSGKSITNNDQLIKDCCAAAEIVKQYKKVVHCVECKRNGECLSEIVTSWPMEEGFKVIFCSEGERKDGAENV
jgi:site-specific DNA-adenine methylase